MSKNVTSYLEHIDWMVECVFAKSEVILDMRTGNAQKYELVGVTFDSLKFHLYLYDKDTGQHFHDSVGVKALQDSGFFTAY
jgi:hypothetical protein